MQRFDSQSVRPAPWLLPSPLPPPNSWLKHAKQHKNNRQSDSSKITHEHRCYTYLGAIIHATIRLAKLTSRPMVVAITIAAAKIMAETCKTTQKTTTVRAIRVKEHTNIEVIRT